MTRHKPVGARLCRLPDRPGRGSTRCPRVLLPSFLAFTLRADSTRQHVPPPRHAPPTRARLPPAPASPPRAPRACRRPASLRRLSPSCPKAAFRDGLSSSGGSCRPPPPSRLRPCEHSALALLVAPLKNMLVSLSLGASLPFGSGGFCRVPWGAYPCASPARGVRAPKPAGRRLLACGGLGSRLLPPTLPRVTALTSARGHGFYPSPGVTASPPLPRGHGFRPHPRPGVTAQAQRAARTRGSAFPSSALGLSRGLAAARGPELGAQAAKSAERRLNFRDRIFFQV